jgi:hypothetical protein
MKRYKLSASAPPFTLICTKHELYVVLYLFIVYPANATLRH